MMPKTADSTATGGHIPVLLQEVVGALSPKSGDVMIDGTFGAGGYSRALLQAADCRVLAIDRDPSAIAAGAALLAQFGDRLELRQGNFSALDDIARGAGLEQADGIVLDIGVSSMQIDAAERGFSFLKDGPLDMRMSGAGESAADVVNRVDAEELANIIYKYGEEPRSRAIARAIVKARAEAAIRTTLQLVSAVERATGKYHGGMKTHPATRTFQALRIYVNRELDELEEGLEAAERMLRAGGRLAVVTFHSLEDRIVKRFLAERSGHMPGSSRHVPDVNVKPLPTFELLFKGAVGPSERETAANPRARSAKLRAARRTAAASAAASTRRSA
jgi:16S rRNA (cytosine1402-N4)-methyltransferase